MAHLFGSWFGIRPRGAALDHARAAEARGDLSEAAARYVDAGRPDEAARILIARGDAEAKGALRLRYYAQAASTAPDECPARTLARVRRAAAMLRSSGESPMTEALRRQLVTAATELESLGEHAIASQAYARLGDRPAEARALEQAGAVSALAAHLEADRARERGERSRRDGHQEMSHLLAAGLRRAALAVGRASEDASLQHRASALATRRVMGGSVRAVLAGQPTALLVGTRLVVGRSDAMAHFQQREVLLRIPSPALSRRHLAVEPEGSRLVVRDLGSRHGTTLGPGGDGPLLVPSALVGDGVELWLAGEVRISLRPRRSSVIVTFDPREPVWLVGFGALPLGIGRWQLERADDDWIELVTEDNPPAFAGGIQLASRIPLLSGDAVSPSRDGRAYLEIAP